MPCLFMFLPKDYGTIQSDKEKDRKSDDNQDFKSYVEP